MPSSNDIALANRLAEAAGAAIRPLFRGEWSEEQKADRSFVTEADRAAEAAMRAILEAECPGDGIQGEEYGLRNESAARRWVLDPIDGTTSFIAGRPIFGTLIALIEDGWPVIGVIDQPILGERWVGMVGQGTTLNGKPARTAPRRELGDAVLATTSPHLFTGPEVDHFMALAKAVAERKIIWGGDCYNYGLLASGHVDLVCEAGLKLHDFAALVPVVEGAGGTMCDWNGEPLHAASTGEVLAIGDPARLEDVLEAMHG
ncbi:inositol monophosphatase family protein [Altererythrobacter sp. H2]|uniref:inositol monophosphatase family protein n=1 Tax=Altererythrobacter sp. H2 TaxID=3108391 RepID=UPI000BCB4968|nr:inositol monophosphatase family protein [Altererythrobacter sp. H2]OZA94785.1 MAG: histidinol phosphate phosphatase [Erythrobacter sp. 34-65-8]WRK96303.1 inositol monophosphatase family protein [Altererythrobacter sp. H2]